MKTTIQRNSGLVTLPVEQGQEAAVKDLIGRWGADALRNSDGTEYSEELKALEITKYTTLCLVRADQEFLRSHPDRMQHNILMSRPVIARSERLEIPILDGYLRDEFRIDYENDPRSWWQVFDRTTGQEVPPERWTIDRKQERVVVRGCSPFHKYTLNFWVWHIWDSTSMYNHISNDWNKPHQMLEDPIYPECQEHLLACLDRWCGDNPRVDVVRLTALFYHFSNFYSDRKQEKYMDFFGYNDAASPYAFERFEQERGYRLTLEDFVDEGYYNCFNRIPRKAYFDFMDFIEEFVCSFSARLNEVIHRHGKKSMVFSGDHWMGAELYSERMRQAGFDAVVTSCPEGTMCRRLADAPVETVKEVRLQPYFFHNEFDVDGVPIEKTRHNWSLVRRAMLRNPVDRIGFGGYISIPYQYPEYIDLIARMCDEFRSIIACSQKSAPYSLPGRVAVLNAWGKIRTWQAQPYWYEKYYDYNFCECLAGLPFEVDFISFDDIRRDGVPDDVTVIINAGSAGSAWSGGENWLDPQVSSAIRKWVYNGGGFVGIGEPTATAFQGAFFQLSDVLGVEKENSFSANEKPVAGREVSDPFIKRHTDRGRCIAAKETRVFCTSGETEILEQYRGNIQLAVHRYGRGRAVYLAGLTYSPRQSRVLYNALSWAGGHEQTAHSRWFCTNPNVECAHYPQTGQTVLINNHCDRQETVFYDGTGACQTVCLSGYGMLTLLPVAEEQKDGEEDEAMALQPSAV